MSKSVMMMMIVIHTEGLVDELIEALSGCVVGEAEYRDNCKKI